MAEDMSTSIRVSGTVKWFDPVKGFGFVMADSGGEDILLHINVLRNFGQNSVANDSRVDIVACRTERGIQATEIVSIVPPEREKSAELGELADVPREAIKQVALEPARVKWFDRAKGFGFANVFGRDEDVFLHIEVIRASGLADLQPGEALAVRVIDGKRGRMAAEVLAWDAATE